MVSFHSRNFPKSRNGLVVSQNFAMQYYGVLNLILMLAIMIKVITGGMGASLIWWAVIGEAIAIALGNLLAYARLKRTIAEIHFVSEHFSLISVYEILNGRENHAYPLGMANPVLLNNENIISIHFNDQVIQLKRADWEDFDLIWDWFYSRQI